MNSKKFLTASLAVTVVYFLLGGFFYAWLMKDWFEAQGGMGAGAEPNIVLIFLATLLYGLLMSYTFPIGYKGGPAVKEGFRFGVIFALIVNGPSTLFMMAMGQCSGPSMIVSWLWEIFCGVLLGIITAKIYGNNR